jgi:hypothetical protein
VVKGKFMKKIIGTCSLCGCAVCISTHYMSTVPPAPECSGCGAVVKLQHGPVIPMQPREMDRDTAMAYYFGMV